MAEVITHIVCRACGEIVSGPSSKSVAETMERHQAKAHPKVGFAKVGKK